MKKLLPVLLSLMLLISMMPTASATVEGAVPFEETQTLNLVLGSNEPLRDGETYEDNVWTRWVKENFNVELNYLWTTTSEAQVEKLRLDLAAGGQLPDILWLPEGEILLASELMQSGLFREVKSLFDQYAGETWKNAMASVENAFLPYTINGEIMAIPVLEQNMNNEVVMGIRGDWLRNLGLEVPTTIDELEVVLDAFTNNDPDGNGVDDTYGLAAGMSNSFVSGGGGDVGAIFGMFGTLNTYWQDFDGDGQLEYGSVQPGAREALARLADWYKKGYLDPECGLKSGPDTGEDFAQGKAGVIFSARYGFSTPNKVSENIEGAELTIAPLPVGPEGEVLRHGTRSTAGCWLINKDCENPEAFFRIQDWLYTYYADPDFGGPCEFGMFEGYDYVMKDGKRSTSSSDFPADAPRSRFYEYSFCYNGAKIPETRLMTYYKMHEGIELTTPMELQYSWNADPYDVDAGYVTVLQQDCRRENLFCAAPTATMQSKGEYLNKMEQETFLRIIYGEVGIEAFDTFVEDWKRLGGDDITREVNEWYAAAGAVE